MRTTIYIDDQLLQQVKDLAGKNGQTFTEFTQDALRAALSRTKKQKRIAHSRLVTFNGDGVQPGVDIDNTADLLNIMDS